VYFKSVTLVRVNTTALVNIKLAVQDLQVIWGFQVDLSYGSSVRPSKLCKLQSGSIDHV